MPNTTRPDARPETRTNAPTRARLLALLVAICFAFPSHADDWFVRTSGNDSRDGQSRSSAFATINRALSAASAGDTVYVGAGTYTDAMRTVRSGAAGSPIRVIGDTDGTHTGDAGEVLVRATGPVLRSSSHSHLEFERLTLDARGSGAVVEAQNSGASITLRSSTLRNAGSAIALAQNSGSALLIEQCALSDSDNHGVRAENGTVVVINSAITGIDRHALHAQNSRSRITAHRVTISGDNQHGAHAENGTIYLVDSLVDGTGSHALRTQNSSAVLHAINATITNSGGHALEARGGTAIVLNSIVSGWSGNGVRRSGGTAIAAYSIFHPDGGGAVTSGTVRTGALLSDDPLFVSETDRRLTASSPAIDVGLNFSTYRNSIGVQNVDLDGNPRLSGAATDYGAYESGAPVAAPLPYDEPFNDAPGDEWSDSEYTTLSTLGAFHGTYGRVGSERNSNATLSVLTQPGTAYRLEFDLYLFGSWDTSGRYRDDFRVAVDDTELFDHTFHTRGGSQSYPNPADIGNQQLGFGGSNDAAFRNITIDFDASSSRSRIDFRAWTTGTDEIWGVDNVRVREIAHTPADVPYFADFESNPDLEWDERQRQAAAGSLSSYLGPFDAESPSLLLNTVPGRRYTIYFDALLFDRWSNDGFSVTADGRVILQDTISGSGTPTLGGVAASLNENLSQGAEPDRLFEFVRATFVASASTTTIAFSAAPASESRAPMFGLDNVAVTDDDSLPGLNAFWGTPAPTPSRVDQIDYADSFHTSIERQIRFVNTRSSMTPSTPADRFGVLLTGLIDIPETGVWEFALRSDDGSRLWINGNEIINNDGRHSPRTQYGSVQLDAGKHHIEVQMYEWTGGANLELSWRGPGVSNYTHVPPHAFTRPRPLFTDTSATNGFNYRSGTTIDHDRPLSLLFGDLNNDGRMDAVVGGNAPYTLIALPGGGYNPVRQPRNRGLYRGAALLDADNDGDLDLWAVHDGSDRNERIYLNDGTGALTDLGSAGLSTPSGNTGVAVLDADLDGWTDVLMRSTSGPALGLNDGAATDSDVDVWFTEADPFEWGTDSPAMRGAGGGVASGDVNNDGLVDLYSLHNGGALLLSSPGNGFVTASNPPAAPSGTNERGPVAFADYDNDGDLDLFVGRNTGDTRSRLYRNDRGAFTDVTLAARLSQTDQCRAVAWGDINHDGTLDLFLSIEGEPDRVYINHGNGRFGLLAEPALASTTTGSNAMLVDVDNDGDLDLAVVRPGTTNALITNTIDGERSLTVLLRGAGAGGVARDAAGARVDLFRNGTFLMRRDVAQSYGWGAQTPHRVHFGGVDPGAEYVVRVTWPGGRQTEHPVTPASATARFDTITVPRMLIIEDTEGGVPVRVVGWREVGSE